MPDRNFGSPPFPGDRLQLRVSPLTRNRLDRLPFSLPKKRLQIDPLQVKRQAQLPGELLDKRRVLQGLFSPQPVLNVRHGQRQIQTVPPGAQHLQEGNGIRPAGHGNHDPGLPETRDRVA